MKLDRMPAIMAALVFLALLQASSIIAQTLILSSVISNLWLGSPLASQTSGMLGFFACFAILHAIRFAQDTMLERYSCTQAQTLHQLLLSRVFDARSLLARKAGSSIVATAATEGIDQVQLYIRVIPPKIVGMMAISLPVLIAAFFLDWISGIILAVMFPVIIFFMILLGKQASARAERQYASYTRLTGRFMDTLRGLGVIKAFGAAAAEGSSTFEYSERLRIATVKTLASATLSSAVLDLCATFGVAAVAMMLAFRLMDGSISLMTGLAALILASEYFLPIRAFASDFHASLNGKNSLKAILDMIGARDLEIDTSHRPSLNAWDEDSELELVDVGFSYDGESDGVSSISLKAKGFQKIAIVGKSGAGKSTLVGLLAGFLAPDAGCAFIDGNEVDLSDAEWKRQVRYIPQSPYIFRATLRKNVAFYAPDAADDKILDAIGAVGLDELVDELPQGLDTVIGEGAHGLSGGQAHRIALARVLLDDSARVLVFDEPTAHLDIETELELKRRMLPVMEGKLVFFATHRLHWVQDMDCVIELEDGGIARIYEPNAKESKSAPCDMEPAVSNTHQQDAVLSQTEEDDGKSPAEDRNGHIGQNALSAESRYGRFPKPPAWLAGYVTRYKRWVFMAVLLGSIAAGCSALLMFTSGYLISATASVGTTLFAIMVPIAFVQIFGFGRPLAHYLERLVSHDWVLKITSDLRRALYWGVEGRIGDPARERATGEYLGLLSDDVDHLQNLYLRASFPILIAAILSLGAAILFLVFSLHFGALILVVLAAITVLVPWACLALTRRFSHDAKARRAREYERLTDNIMGATDWILSNRASFVEQSHSRSDEDIRKLDSSSRMIERVVTLVDKLLLGGITCLILAWAGQQFSGDAQAANWIAAFALGFFPIIEALGALPSSASQATTHEDAIARLDEYVTEGESAVRTRDAGAASPGKDCMDAANAVELDSVSYRYPGSKTPALDDISLSVRAGESIAILGRSGSGKSTLANVVRGVLQPGSGTVGLASGSPLPIGYMGQSPYLFNRSLRDNLTLGVLEAADAKLEDILRSVGLEAKLESLEEGLDTIIGETGTGFSGGEAHRIALARVLVADAPIVIVDEPFSALDPITEASLLETLFEVCSGRTLVVITHHLAEIHRFDRVVFIEGGKVALDGTPDELMELSAFFRTLLEFDRGM